MEVVNGYPCKNCTDVDNAKKGIDPAHPKDGPNGAYAADRGPAVTFSGALANVTPPAQAEKTQPYRPGAGFTFTA